MTFRKRPTSPRTAETTVPARAACSVPRPDLPSLKLDFSQLNALAAEDASSPSSGGETASHDMNDSLSALKRLNELNGGLLSALRVERGEPPAAEAKGWGLWFFPFSSPSGRRSKRSRASQPLKAGALVCADDAVTRWPEPSPRRVGAATKGTPAVCPWPEPSASPPSRRGKGFGAAERPKAEAPRGTGTLSGPCMLHIEAGLSSELTRLQELLQAALLAGSPPPEILRSIGRRLGWLRSDIDALAPLEGGEGASGRLASLFEIASACEEFALSLRRELRSHDQARAERAEAERLCAAAGWRVEVIPHDGDCLFECVRRWLALQRWEAALHDSAAGVRAAVTAVLRERMAQDVGLARRVAPLLSEAARGLGTDGTSVALRDELARRGVTALALAEGAPAAECLAAYLDVMGRDGIFGERLEIEAIAALVRAPVHIYYYAGGSGEHGGGAGAEHALSMEAIAPEAFGFATAAAAPLRLLHFVHERHFALLVPVA